MKKSKIFMCIVGIIAASAHTVAQQDGNGPERFYNVDAYKADITLTFSYDFSQKEANNSKSVIASQTFQHFFETGTGEVSTADMFQVERGDKGDGKAQKGDIMEGVDMDAVAQAMKNSGMDPSVMDELKKTKGETASYNMSFDKYKMWMTNPVSGVVSTRLNSKYYEETKGTGGPCGEGLSGGPYKNFREYGVEGQSEKGKPSVNNPNSLLFLVNLNNNTYSFSTSVDTLRGLMSKGTDHEEDCGKITDKEISMTARSFISIKSKKEGLVYKFPLPQDGMTLSGSKVITNSFGLWQSLDKEGANWSVKIDWKIYPAGG